MRCNAVGNFDFVKIRRQVMFDVHVLEKISAYGLVKQEAPKSDNPALVAQYLMSQNVQILSYQLYTVMYTVMYKATITNIVT